MRYRVLAFFIFVFIITFFDVQAQCNYTVTVSAKSTGTLGEITTKLSNAGNYKCVLYAYVKGDRIKIKEKSGNSSSITFKDLPIDRYYKVEFYFKDEDVFVCKAWESELIRIKE